MENPRAKEILEHLNRRSPLSIDELASLLAVSTVTVRRDLSELENDGLIIRQRGGAALPSNSIEPMFHQRHKQHLELKKQIAKYAAEQVTEGEVIAIDVGTTAAEFAKELLKKNNLTVFTNSFQAASILAKSQHQVYFVGGMLRKSEMSMVGSIAKDTVLKFNYDRFYMGLAGISLNSGPTDYSLEDAEVKRCFISKSKEVIALVDKTKFGKSSLVTVCEMDDITTMITNQDDGTILQEMAHFNGKLVLV